MLVLPISKSRFKALSFYQNSPKIKLFLQKNAKFSSAWGKAPRPRASGGCGLCPHTPSLRRLGALHPHPHLPLAAGGFAPRPLNQPLPLRMSGYAPAVNTFKTSQHTQQLL